MPFRTVHAAISHTRGIRATNAGATAAVMLREVTRGIFFLLLLFSFRSRLEPLGTMRKEKGGENKRAGWERERDGMGGREVREGREGGREKATTTLFFSFSFFPLLFFSWCSVPSFADLWLAICHVAQYFAPLQGVYYFDETLSLGEADSFLTISAYKGELAVISGAKHLTNLKWTTATGDVVCTDLSDVDLPQGVPAMQWGDPNERSRATLARCKPPPHPPTHPARPGARIRPYPFGWNTVPSTYKGHQLRQTTTLMMLWYRDSTCSWYLWQTSSLSRAHAPPPPFPIISPPPCSSHSAGFTGRWYSYASLRPERQPGA